ncbi:unnamed protein product [Caenorhabditis angaria]|uniref:C-type lectin domain-containing protein n=1 Tax=Caenorhabditis angaria TaxID=860376 RepID=A0A9P1IV07_9PELO|nr:unnamed protein product [Caenorhabditis angaria]
MKFLLALLLLGVSSAFAQTCNTGGIYNSHFNRCYQYFTAPSQYLIAEEQCTNLGGHLASIQNGQENILVQSNGALAFGKSNYTDFWIGANDLETSGKWAWTDGTTFSYTSWGTGQPQTGADCVSQDKSDGTWSTIGCTSYRPFVCVTPPINPVTCPPVTTPIPATCPAPTPCPPKVCAPACDQGWTYLQTTDSCYHVYHNLKWQDAEAACVLLDAHLASIHSLIENTLVNNLAACGVKEGNPKDLAWIGLHQTNGKDWVWTDGTPTDYLNWAPKQPDNPGKELCVETAPDLSHDKWYENWNNEACNTVMRAYVCKKPAYH